MQVQRVSFSSKSVLNQYAVQNLQRPVTELNPSKDIFVNSNKNPVFLGSKKDRSVIDPFRASVTELPEEIQNEIAKTNAYIDMSFPSIPKELETIHYPTIEECLDIIKKRAKLDSFDSYFEEIKSFPKNNIEYRELPNSTDLISVDFGYFNDKNLIIKLIDDKHNLIYEYADIADGYKFTDYINKESFNYVDENEGGVASKIVGDILIQYGRNNKYAIILGPSANVITCGYYPDGSVVRYCSGEYLKKEEIFSPEGEKIREVYYLDKADKEYHTKYVDVKPTT